MQDTIDAVNNDEETKTAPEKSSNEDGRFVTIDISNISSRYGDICPLGVGTKALVFSAIDQQCRRRIAVKKVAVNSLTSPTDLKHLLREIRILRRLDHENVVRICHTLVSHQDETSYSTQSNQTQDQSTNEVTTDAVYIGMELMDTDLQSILKHESLAPCYVKLFTYQMLRGLKFIHSANVIHRDLSPSNVFVNTDTLMLKIGDFGVSRIFDSAYQHQRQMSMASTTTSYQAPEVLLHPHHYDKAIDVWAAGCIFAEMITGKPLFPASVSSGEQLELILASVSVMRQNWRSVTGVACEGEECCRYHEAFGDRENHGQPLLPLTALVPQGSAQAINLLRQLLTFDPKDRVTATDALMHPYLVPYGNPADEPVCQTPFNIEDELDDYNFGQYQEMINGETSASASRQSSEHSEQQTETSIEDGNYISHTAVKQSICQNDSCKNLLALIDSSNHPSTASNHSAAVTMSESEARTLACDFDYGVQINDGSINRDRMCPDFQPISCDTPCFDPYKWDSASRRDDASKTSSVLAAAEESPKPCARPIYNKVIDGSQDPGSDHGYHSSYCSSNLSHGNGKTHPHSMWSLSSPDISVDHEKATSGHRASTPDLMSPGAIDSEDSHVDRHSPTFGSENNRMVDHSESSRRRHKDDLPRHHQSYHHASLYIHHHHHHHHHHKHHRHSSRHGQQQQQQQQQQASATQRMSSNEGDSNANGSRCHQRRCVVTDTVPELVEEAEAPRATERVKNSEKYKSSSSDSDSKDRLEKKNKSSRFSRKSAKSGNSKLTITAPDNGFHEPSDDATGASDDHAEDVPTMSAESVSDKPFVSAAPQSNVVDAQQTFTVVKESADGASETSPAAEPRSRTWSDVSGLKNCSGGLCMSFFDNLLKKTPNPSSSCLLQRLRTYSGDRRLLADAEGGAPPPKCSSPETSRNGTFPRKRVECPF